MAKVMLERQEFQIQVSVWRFCALAWKLQKRQSGDDTADHIRRGQSPFQADLHMSLILCSFHLTVRTGKVIPATS